MPSCKCSSKSVFYIAALLPSPRMQGQQMISSASYAAVVTRVQVGSSVQAWLFAVMEGQNCFRIGHVTLTEV